MKFTTMKYKKSINSYSHVCVISAWFILYTKAFAASKNLHTI